MASSETENVSELGITIEDFVGDQPKVKSKRCNTKLKIYREFALATLSALVESKSKQLCEDASKQSGSPQVSALDALACSGIAGIQWKKHLTSGVHVTMAEHDDMTKLTENAQLNALSCSELKLNPLRVPGDPLKHQGESEVHVCQAEAKAVMTMEAFNFIYMNPYKNCSSYFEPALHGINGGGLICLVIADVSMFARSPHVVKRYFAADVVKTEYLKELAARIVLASLARAAAKYNKGITTQYVLCHEDYLLICVKACRSNGAADTSQNEIERLLHCRFCEERTFIPNQLAPIEDPYSLLSCTCKQKNPGKTAVLLGPMWKGPLSNTVFLDGLHAHGTKLGLSAKFFEFVHILQVENLCAKSNGTLAVKLCLRGKQIAAHNGNQGHIGSRPTVSDAASLNNLANSENASPSQGDAQGGSGNHKTTSELTAVATSETVAVDSKADDHAENLEGKKGKHGDSTTCNREVNKRKAELLENDKAVSTAKRQRIGDESAIVQVPFFYNVNKFKKTNIPKLDKLVTILQSHGHRASRTHFDPCAIRTSATVEEFLQVLG